MLESGTRCMADSSASRSLCVSGLSCSGSSAVQVPRVSGAVPANRQSTGGHGVHCLAPAVHRQHVLQLFEAQTLSYIPGQIHAGVRLRVCERGDEAMEAAQQDNRRCSRELWCVGHGTGECSTHSGQSMPASGCIIRRALQRNASCHRCRCRGSGDVSDTV